MRIYLAGLALVVLLLGGLACSSEEHASQEPPEPTTSEKTAKPEKANDGSKESSAAPAPEERDAPRDDAPEDAGTDVSALLAKDAELNQPEAGYAIVTDGVGALSLGFPSHGSPPRARPRRSGRPTGRTSRERASPPPSPPRPT